MMDSGLGGEGWITSDHLDQMLVQQEKDAAQHVKNICGVVRLSKAQWSDDAFPPGDRSLYGDGGGNKVTTPFRAQGTSGPSFQWKRPKQLGGSWSVITDSLQPQDVVQGRLGDCWFLSALSVLADRPHLIDRILLTKQYNPEGAYAVRFFYDGEWKRVIVDDMFPTEHGQLVYGRCQGRQLWVSIIEKAYAKLHGSYAAIVSGQTFQALADLTGAPCESIDIEKDDFDPDLNWGRLLSFKQSNFLMGAACGRQGASASHLESMGLISSHAYSLVDAVAESGYRLLKLRNPWGRVEWKGDWGDSSNKWTAEWRRKLDHDVDSGDGMFWMSYEDFLLYFATIDVCKEQSSWYSLTTTDVFSGAHLTTSSKMFELKVVTSTWMFVSLIQKTKRGQSSKYEYQDLGLMVSQCPAGVDRLEEHLPSAQLWPTLTRIGHTEVLATNQNQSYLLLPFSLAPRQGDLEYTLAIYSANPVSIRPVAYNPMALNIGLHLSVAAAESPKELFPGIWMHLCHRSGGIFLLVVNADRDNSVQIEVNCTQSVNLTSSRKTLRTKDIVPPQTRQLLMVLTQARGVNHYAWNCNYSFAQLPPLYRMMHGNEPPHQPPLTGPTDMHMQLPLDGPIAAAERQQQPFSGLASTVSNWFGPSADYNTTVRPTAPNQSTASSRRKDPANGSPEPSGHSHVPSLLRKPLNKLKELNNKLLAK